ncbi:MAG: hypothetical protein PHN55_03095 [Dysgonamonadaceae bacterium]|nr:hypothetical protein [Dysgonamonadaceae bacterium]
MTKKSEKHSIRYQEKSFSESFAKKIEKYEDCKTKTCVFLHRKGVSTVEKHFQDDGNDFQLLKIESVN